MIFGAIMVILSATSLISWIRISKLPGASNGSNIVAVLLDALELLLGIGILLRRETARMLYVIVAVILLLVSFLGTYNYFHAINRVNGAQKVNITLIQQEIKKTQNDHSLAADSKAQTIQQLQGEVNAEQHSVDSTKRLLLPLIEGYVITVLPLVFFTRPKVKEVFD